MWNSARKGGRQRRCQAAKTAEYRQAAYFYRRKSVGKKNSRNVRFYDTVSFCRIAASFVFFACLAAASAQETGKTYTLNELINSASDANPALTILGRQERQAELSVKEAWGSLFPVIEGSLAGQYEANPIGIDDMLPGFSGYFKNLSSSPVVGGLLPPLKEPDNWGFQFSATLTQPLFTWGKIANSIALAKTGLEAAKIQRLAALRETETKVAVQAGTLFYLTQVLSILDMQEQTGNRLAALAEENLKNGLLLPVDFSEISIRVLEVGVAKKRLENQIDKILFSLRDLTQIEYLDKDNIDFSFVPENVFVLSAAPVADAMTRIRSGSTESALLALQEKAAEKQKNIVSSDAWAKPDIALKLGYTYATPNFFFFDPAWQKNGRWNFTAAIASSSTVFNGGTDIAQLRKAEIDVEISRDQYRQSMSSIEKTLSELASSMELEAALSEYYSQRQRQYEAMEEQKKKEWDNGYGEERAWLEARLDTYKGAVEQLENTASYYADYCMYEYLCGSFPADYL